MAKRNGNQAKASLFKSQYKNGVRQMQSLTEALQVPSSLLQANRVCRIRIVLRFVVILQDTL